MSDRPVGLFIEDMLDRIDRMTRYTTGLDRDAFVDPDLVWGIATNELPRLKLALTRLRDAGL